MKHFQIGWDGSQYRFGMGTFSCLNEFVEHFENKPLIGGDSGEFIHFISRAVILGWRPGILPIYHRFFMFSSCLLGALMKMIVCNIILLGILILLGNCALPS